MCSGFFFIIPKSESNSASRPPREPYLHANRALAAQARALGMFDFSAKEIMLPL